tara:strand:- start:39689 stop:40309 length:621 start_codon:yes stop_codon:yes gene_type:complete
MIAGIELTENGIQQKRTPVFKKRNIGESAKMALIRTEKRKVKKENAQGELVDDLKENGAPKWELVLHGIALKGNTMRASLSGEMVTLTDGDEVRMICRGGQYKDWIDAVKAFPGSVRAGDVVKVDITMAIPYISKTNKGAKLTTKEQVDQHRENKPGQNLGLYGSMEIARQTDANIITKCCDLHAEFNAINLDNGPTVGDDDLADV